MSASTGSPSRASRRRSAPPRRPTTTPTSRSTGMSIPLGGREMPVEDRVLELAGEVQPPDGAAIEWARERHLVLTKPLGSLGCLEELGARLAGMAGEVPPPALEGP